MQVPMTIYHRGSSPPIATMREPHPMLAQQRRGMKARIDRQTLETTRGSLTQAMIFQTGSH